MAERRRSLLDAAGAVFRRDGYLNATVDSIAEVAGLTKGAVYSHFQSKADLFLTLLEERIEQRASDHDTLTRQRLGYHSVTAFLEHAIARSREDPGWNLALIEFRLLAARDDELNDRYRRAHEMAKTGLVRSLTALYEATGVVPPAPLETLASTALAMESGTTLEALVTDETEPDASGIELVAHILGFPSPGTTTQEDR